MFPQNLTTAVSTSRLSVQVVLGALLSNLFMVVLVGLIIYQSHLQYERNAESMTQSLSHVLEESLSDTLQKIDIALLAASDEANKEFASGKVNREALNAFLLRQQERLPEISSLRIVDENGIIQFGTGVRADNKVDISDRSHFQYLRDHNDAKLYVGDPIFARIDKQWMLPIARRLNHADGSFAGGVYTLISLEKISEMFSHLDVGPHGIVNLRDGNLNIIVRHPETMGPGTFIGKNTLSPPLKKLIDAGNKIGTYHVPGVLDSIERTYSYRKIDEHPLYVTVGFAADDYLAEWRNFSLKLIAVLLLFMLLSIYAARLIYRGEQRRAEAAKVLQVLNRDFLTLLESTTDFIYFKDKDSRIRFCSQTLANITGHRNWREMVGKHDFEIFPEETARIYHEEELPVFRDGEAILNRIDPYFDGQGKKGWVSTNKWPVFDSDGKTVIGIFGISRDITEFKQAEIDLRESEQRFRNLFHKDSSIMLLIDPTSGVIVDANAAAAKFYGYSDVEMHGMLISQINTLPAEEIQRERELALEEKRNYFVFPHRLANGEIRTVEVYSTPIESSGKALLFSIVHDITERRLAEAKLVENEAYLRAVIDNEPECIKIVDSQGRLRQMNPAGLEMIEADSFEQVSGGAVIKLIAPEYREAFTAMHKRVLAGEVMQLEFEVLGLKGGRRWLETHAVPMNDHGEVVHLAVTRDITARKHFEDALRRSDAYNKLLFADSRVPMVVMDPDTFRYTDCNQAAVAIYGMSSREELLGLTPLDVSDAFQYDGTASSVAAKSVVEETKTNGSSIFLWRHRRKNGEIWDGKVYLMQLQQNEKTFFLFSLEDVTEQNRAREELRAKTEALQRSNSDLERFAYSVSHDMRQPLRAVSGHLQLLQRSLKDKLDEDERENMNFALEGARRMDSMIVSLLDYSRVGRKTETMQMLESRVALNEAMSFLTPLIKDTNAQVELNGEWPQIYASRDELTRLFQNLISNAIKFCDVDQAARVEIDSSMNNHVWRVSVRDHGVGIDPSQIDRLFMFFSRLQSRVRFEGTGMGLALCRRIVEHHQGRIWVESEGVGKGSNFIFELPMVSAEAIPKELE